MITRSYGDHDLISSEQRLSGDLKKISGDNHLVIMT